MIRFVSAVSLLVAGAVALPSVASAQMEQPMSGQSAGMSHKMTKKQMMMKKKKMMMMHKKKMMNTGGM